MGERESWERLRRNEEMFRQVNEQISDLAEAFAEGVGGEEGVFVCECSRVECLEQVTLRLEDYRELRTHRNRFVVLPGHEEPEIEDVVSRGSGYLIVRKRV